MLVNQNYSVHIKTTPASLNYAFVKKSGTW